jgi:competence protein ComEC
VAFTTWAGALAGLVVGVPAIAVCAAGSVGSLGFRQRAVAIGLAFAAAGALSGTLAAARIESTLTATVPNGRIEFVGRVVEDAAGPDRPAVVVPEAVEREGSWRDWSGPPLAVATIDGTDLVAGDVVRVSGTIKAAPHVIRGDAVAGRVVATAVEKIGSAGGPLFGLGNAVRSRVGAVLGGGGAERALLSGFLIGDVSRLPDPDLEALRRSGLTHFVAVSGSNVALFLAAWWVLTAPFGLGPKRRAVIGAVGLVVFVVATRWEASVVRASVMAGMVLGGAAAGIAIDAWVALGGAVAVLLLVSGHLAADVGFQLSVAATLGILVGAGLFGDKRPRWLWTPLGATVAAQAAVVPILLLHFGTVPLLSPVANLVAGPFVAAATVVGAVGVFTGLGAVVAVGSALAGAVLAIAHLAAGWPQLGVVGATAAVVAGVAAGRAPLRPWIVLGATIVLATPLVLQPGPPSVATVTFVDVGQGDAVLVRDPSGLVAVIDGGRDPVAFDDALRRYGVRKIDLLVVTHGDDDHVGGLREVFDRVAVGRMWVPKHPDLGPILHDLVDEAMALGIPVDRVVAGRRIGLGQISVATLGPRRRYSSQNDGSVVLWVAAGRTVLLAGDAEAAAQRDLPELDPDVLLVPHHGSSTTDLDWLERTLDDVAVISVGPNTYGHPTPEIMEVLRESGAEIHVTRDEGDVSIPIG